MDRLQSPTNHHRQSSHQSINRSFQQSNDQSIDQSSSTDNSTESSSDSESSSESDGAQQQQSVARKRGRPRGSKTKHHSVVSGKLARQPKSKNVSVKSESKSESNSNSSDSASLDLDLVAVQKLMDDADNIRKAFPRSRSLNQPSAVDKRHQHALQSYISVTNTRLSVAVCGARGAGKSQLINYLAVNQSLTGSLWGRLPLASGLSAERVTEAPTYLIHSDRRFLRIVWKPTVISNPCFDSSVSFVKNDGGEWQSECWQHAWRQFSGTADISDKPFLHCLNLVSNLPAYCQADAQQQLLELWTVNRFLFSLEHWFGEHISSIQRVEIGMPHWAFHRDITLIDMPGWEAAKKVTSSESLRSVDGVILVSARASGSEEVKTLFEYGAFNQSKQAIDVSAEGQHAWKPPFLLSFFRHDDALPQSNESRLRDKFRATLRLLSDNPSVLPHIYRWDERAEHFDTILRNSFICPISNTPPQNSSPDLRESSISNSIQRFVSAIRADSCWTILNRLSTFVLFAQKAAKASPANHSTEQLAVSTDRFEAVLKSKTKDLEQFVNKLSKQHEKKLREMVKMSLADSTDLFTESNSKPSSNKRGRKKKPAVAVFDAKHANNVGITNYLVGLHNTYKKVIVYDFVSEVIHVYGNECRNHLPVESKSGSKMHSETPDGLDQPDLVDPDHLIDALIDQAERSSGLAKADRQVQQFERSDESVSLLQVNLQRSLEELKNEPERENRSARKVQSATAIANQKMTNLVRKLTSKLVNVTVEWRKSLVEYQKTCVDSLRGYLVELNQQSRDTVSSNEAEQVLQQCKTLRDKIDQLLQSYSDYVAKMESNVAGANLSVRRCLTTNDRITAASLPRAEDLYTTIADVVGDSAVRSEADVAVGYGVRSSIVPDDGMVLLTEPSTNQPELAIMRAKFDVTKNELVLSTPAGVNERIRTFQQKFSAAQASSSAQSSQRSSSPFELKPSMFGESDQANERTLFPIYSICWTDNELSFDGQHLAIHSDWDGLPYCHFLLVEPGEQSQKLVASLKRSAPTRSTRSGIKIVVELPSVNMLPQYAIDIGKHIMEYFDFDFCWRVSPYARTREKHSIMITMRECTLARSMFSMQVTSARLFDYVTTLLAEKLRTHKTVLATNIRDVVELETVGMSRADARALERRETTRITELLERLSMSDAGSTGYPRRSVGPLSSDPDIFNLVHFLRQVKQLLDQQPNHENYSGLEDACKDALSVLSPWLNFRLLAFWPTQWVLQRVIPNFPLVHSVMARSAYARIMVLEHVRSLRGMWMADQNLIDGAWKSNVSPAHHAAANAERKKRGKKKKTEKVSNDCLTLRPSDVMACETDHWHASHASKHEDGCVVLITSFGVEYSEKAPKVKSGSAAPSSVRQSHSVPPTPVSHSIPQTPISRPKAESDHDRLSSDWLSPAKKETIPVISGISQPTPEEWERLFQDIDRTNAITVQKANPEIGYSTLCNRKKLWDEEKVFEAKKPLAKRRGKHAMKAGGQVSKNIRMLVQVSSSDDEDTSNARKKQRVR